MNFLLDYYIETTTEGSPLAFILPLILGIALLASLILMFRKAGYAWWKVFIPIYNIFCYHELIGLPGSFTLAYFLVPFLAIIPILGILVPIILFVMHLVECNNTAKAFGKGTGWAVLIFFFEPIMFMIIGFSSNIEYVYGGKKVLPRLVPINNNNQPMNFDPNTGQPINNTQPSMNYDPNTGQPINNMNNNIVNGPVVETPLMGQSNTNMGTINNGQVTDFSNVNPVQESSQINQQVNSDLPDSIDSIIIKQ